MSTWHSSDLFSLDDIAEDFGDVLERWLRFAQDFDSVCKLYFGSSQKGVYLEPSFLSLVRCAESYHRRSFGHRDRHLRDRLQDLAARVVDIIPQLAFQDDAFVRQVVVTRNYLTHDDDKLERVAAYGDSLKQMTYELRRLMTACLLLELGFPSHRCKEILAKRSTWI